MTKYVIMYDDSCEIILDTLTDAEEYILSIAEEAAYEDFLADIMFSHASFFVGNDMIDKYHEPEEWFDQWRLEDLSDVWVGGTTKRQPRQTSYSAMLGYFAEDWRIEEVKHMPTN